MTLKLLSKNYFNSISYKWHYYRVVTSHVLPGMGADGVGSGVTTHEIGISGALSKGTGDSVSFKQSLCMYAVHQFSLIEDNYFNFHH